MRKESLYCNPVIFDNELKYKFVFHLCLLSFIFLLLYPPSCNGQGLNRMSKAQPHPILVSENLHIIDLTGHYSFLRDPEHLYGIEDVSLGSMREQFVPIEKNLALRYTPDAVWLKLVFDRAGSWPTTVALNLLPAYLREIKIFVPLVDNPISADDFRVILRGSAHPHANPGMLQVSQVAQFSFPSDSERAIVYIRAETDGTLGLRGWLASQSGLVDLIISRTASIVGLMTLSLSSTLLSLVFWIYSRRRYFLYISFMFLADCTYVGASSGIMLYGIMGISARVNQIFTSETVLFLILANMLFVREHLRGFELVPYQKRMIRWMMIFTLFAIFMGLFGIYRPFISVLLILCVAFLGLFVLNNIFSESLRNKPGAKAAFLAGVIKLVSGALTISWGVGGIETYGFWEYSYWVAVAFFTPLMAFSLTQKVRSIDRRRQETSTIRIARKAERAARALVVKRTAELEAAKEMAEHALAAEREGQQEQLRFIDIVRHQYQTPLAVIRTSAAALRHTLHAHDEDNLSRVSRIDIAVKDLIQLLDTSLQRSRFEGTQTRPKFESVSVVEMIGDIVERNRSFYSVRELDLEWDDDLTDKTARLDSSMIGMALQNLIDNAMKFSPPETPVTISCGQKNASLVISVRDQGMGIPKDEREGIGKRYYRASNAGAVAGTGLGLHIVNSVACAHGGVFTIENASDRGVIAMLSIPALVEEKL